jgi:TatD DNase family protein
MVETHAHLDFPEYNADREAVIQRAKESGIKAIINVGASINGSISSVELAKEHESIYAACGIHPHEAKSVNNEAIECLENLIVSNRKVVAIGEVGIDLYRMLSPKDKQYSAFCDFLKLSRKFELPLIIHCREASPDRHEASDMLFDAMKHNLDLPYKGVMHCFSGDEVLLGKCLDSGLNISYTCNVTYKNAGRLRDVLKKTPPDKLLLETDSPFLSPEGKRGARNEPSNMAYLLRAISETLGLPEHKIEEQTDINASGLFFKKIKDAWI